MAFVTRAVEAGMPQMRIVTYETEVTCGDCRWQTRARSTRREASIGRAARSDAWADIKRSVTQRHHSCPECDGTDLEIGEPEIAEQTDLAADMNLTGVDPDS